MFGSTPPGAVALGGPDGGGGAPRFRPFRWFARHPLRAAAAAVACVLALRAEMDSQRAGAARVEELRCPACAGTEVVRPPRRLRVFSYVDRASNPDFPEAAVCDVLKGWVANNLHGTLLFGPGPHVPGPPPGSAADPQPKNPAYFHPTVGKWLHTFAWMARQPPDDLLLFADAFDAFFQLGPDEIARRHAVAAREAGRDDVLVMSAEAWCSPWFSWGERAEKLCRLFEPARWPEDAPLEAADARHGAGPSYPALSPELPAVEGSFNLTARYLNTGAFLGPASALLRFASLLLHLVPYRGFMGGGPGDHVDDQALASWLALNSSAYHLGLRLDRAGRLAHSAHAVFDDEMHLARVPGLPATPSSPRSFWRHRRTGSVPALVHFNGDGKHPPRLRHAKGGLWWYNWTADDVADARAAGTEWWRGTVRIEGRGKPRLADWCPEVWDASEEQLEERIKEEGTGWFGGEEELEGPTFEEEVPLIGRRNPGKG